MRTTRTLLGLLGTAFCAMALSASTAAATELFDGDFETGNLTQWDYVQAIPGRVSVVSNPASEGTYSGRFEVKEGDKEPDTGSQRAETLSGETYEESDVRYFRILSRVDSWDFGHWGIIWKATDESEGPPPLTLQLYTNGSTPMLWLGSGSGSSDYWEAPLPAMKEWVEIVIRVEFGEKGSVMVWLNGKPQTMLNEEPVYDEAETLFEGPGEDRIGIGRSSSSTGTSIVYHDGYRVTDEFFSDPPEPKPLFAGNFETGNLTQWDHVQAIPGRVSAVTSPVSEGTYAGRFEVKEGDKEPATGSQRAEAVSGEIYEESDIRYFRILSRVDSWDFSHWGMIWQMHDDGSGSPPLSLQLYMDKSTPKLWLGPGNGSDDYWEASLPALEKWFEIVIRVEFGAKGSLKVWLDGAPQTMIKGTNVDTLGEAPGYDKLGIYRSSSSVGTAVVYHDDYRITDEFFSDPP